MSTPSSSQHGGPRDQDEHRTSQLCRRPLHCGPGLLFRGRLWSVSHDNGFDGYLGDNLGVDMSDPEGTVDFCITEGYVWGNGENGDYELGSTFPPANSSGNGGGGGRTCDDVSDDISACAEMYPDPNQGQAYCMAACVYYFTCTYCQEGCSELDQSCASAASVGFGCGYC